MQNLNKLAVVAVIASSLSACSATGQNSIGGLVNQAAFWRDTYSAELKSATAQISALNDLGINAQTETRVQTVFPGEKSEKKESVMLAFAVKSTSRDAELAVEAVAKSGDPRWDTLVTIVDTAPRIEQIKRDFKAELNLPNLSFAGVAVEAGHPKIGMVITHPQRDAQ